MSAEFQYDVLLSHNSAGKPRVRRLAERLRAANLRQINFGFPSKAALSPTALGSDWVGLKHNTGLFRDPANAGRRFIPLLLESLQVKTACPISTERNVFVPAGAYGPAAPSRRKNPESGQGGSTFRVRSPSALGGELSNKRNENAQCD